MNFMQYFAKHFKRANRLVWLSAGSACLALILIVGSTWALVAEHHTTTTGTAKPTSAERSTHATSQSSGGTTTSTTLPAADGKAPATTPKTTTKPTTSQATTTTTQTTTTPPVTQPVQTTPALPYTIPGNAIIVSSTAAFQSAVSSASAGATIVLRAGTYTGISSTISKQLTIEAYPNETVWMDGQGTLQYALYLVTNASGGMVRGIGFRNYASTKDFSQKPAMVIVASSVANGVTIDRCTFENSAAAGASVQSNNSVVTNNVFKDNNWIGLHVNHADGIDVENNIMSGNNTGNNATSGTTAAAAGAKFTYTRGATIKNNLFINNNANGLWIDLQASDIVMSGNTASGNARNGIYYEVSTRGTITGNTVTNNAAYGIELSGSNNTTVTGNTLSGNTGGNTFVQEDPRTAGNDSYCAAGASYGADCDSYNNTVQAG